MSAIDKTEAPNLSTLYGTLWSQVKGLREGTISPANANAVSNTVGKMFTAVRVQMDYYRLTGETPPHLPPFLIDKS